LKLVVTDACIFIDLYDIGLTDPFFLLDLEVHTTVDVLAELYVIQKDTLRPHLSLGKLILHNMEEADRHAMHGANYPKSLSVGDQTVLYLAEKIGAMVLSGDRVVRIAAGARAIECHGIFWIFDQLVGASLLSNTLASDKLKMLVDKNIVYRNNPKLGIEIDARLKKWADGSSN
jgi:hypothetical protein